ncbi:MAG: putative quinol monooxygenase [bacterium]
MIIIHVFVHVTPQSVNDFITATLENVRNSVKESGVVRFELIQQDDDPTRFLLVEIYRTPDDQISHKETSHYATWRDAVASMMAEPRASVKYHAVSSIE